MRKRRFSAKTISRQFENQVRDFQTAQTEEIVKLFDKLELEHKILLVEKLTLAVEDEFNEFKRNSPLAPLLQ